MPKAPSPKFDPRTGKKRSKKAAGQPNSETRKRVNICKDSNGGGDVSYEEGLCFGN